MERLLILTLVLLPALGCTDSQPETAIPQDVAPAKANPRRACLEATVDALKTERTRFENELRYGRPDKRREYQDIINQLERDLQKYSAMRSEDYQLPPKISLIGKVSGNVIYFIGQSRSGPFYHILGPRPRLSPSTYYRLQVYPLYRRPRAFPTWYVTIANAREAGTISWADTMGVKSLTEVNIWRPGSGQSRPWTSADPEFLAQVVALLGEIQSSDDPPRPTLSPDASIWNVELVEGGHVVGRLTIHGTTLLPPTTKGDQVRANRLVKLLLTLVPNSED